MTNKKTYKIRKEVHPLKSEEFVYRAYEVDGTPLYIGREKPGELIDYIHQMHPDWKFNLDWLEAVK